MPSTVLSPRHTRYFTNGAGGFVVRPNLARIRCCYPRDGHSTSKEEGCGINNWCPETAAVTPWSGGFAQCAWRPDQLDKMLEEQDREAPRGVRRDLGFSRLPDDLSHLDQEWLQSYNEVILDASAWLEHLPGTIEAVFLLEGSSHEDQRRAVDAHALFLKDYALTDADVPLLLYDPQRTPPFSHYVA